jgi:hypothetical protein
MLHVAEAEVSVTVSPSVHVGAVPLDGAMEKVTVPVGVSADAGTAVTVAAMDNGDPAVTDPGTPLNFTLEFTGVSVCASVPVPEAKLLSPP